MHYQHLDHLYPHFEELVEDCLTECPIRFENSGESIVTSLVDAICDGDLSDNLRAVAVSSLLDLQERNEHELTELMNSVIGNINLLGVKTKKEEFKNALPDSLKQLWTSLDHSEIEV
ncbi:MAG: hypothetical protein ACSHYA_10475 [Opitutaceae bacterium]